MRRKTSGNRTFLLWTFLTPLLKITIVLSAVMFFWLNGWSHHIWCAILLNDNTDRDMSSLSTLVPEGPWDVFYATRHQVYRGLTHNVFLMLLWFDMLHPHTNTQTHTAHSETSRLTHSYKYIFTPPVICSRQLLLLH